MSENDDRTPEPFATCAEHDDRNAIAVCPHCDKDRCFECWHQPIHTCHQCVSTDPGAFGHPILWERSKGPRGLFSGLFDSFFPSRQAPQFATSSIGPALAFFLLTFIPAGLLSGVVPFTHTLFFGDVDAATLAEKKLHLIAWHVAQVSEPSTSIAVDVLRASGLGLLLSLVLFVAVAAPYVSLCRAYGKHEHATVTAFRAVLYRAWLLPLSDQQGVLRSLFWWVLPAPAPGVAMLQLVQLLIVVPVVLYFIHLRSVSRFSCGLTSFYSFVPVVIAFIVMSLLDPLLLHALTPWLPAGMSAVQ